MLDDAICIGEQNGGSGLLVYSHLINAALATTLAEPSLLASITFLLARNG